MARRDCDGCGHPAKRHVSENEVPEGQYDMTWAAKLLGVFHECGGNGPEDPEECNCEGYE